MTWVVPKVHRVFSLALYERRDSHASRVFGEASTTTLWTFYTVLSLWCICRILPLSMTQTAFFSCCPALNPTNSFNVVVSFFLGSDEEKWDSESRDWVLYFEKITSRINFSRRSTQRSTQKKSASYSGFWNGAWKEWKGLEIFIMDTDC